VRRLPAFSPDHLWHAVRLILVSAGLAVGVAAERAAFGWDDPRRWVPDLVVGLTLVGAAALTLPRRPGTGWLLAATGFAWFAGNFDSALQYVHRGPLVHALVAFIGWRVRTRVELVAVVVAYGAAVVAPVWRDDVASVVLASPSSLLPATAGRRAAGEPAGTDVRLLPRRRSSRVRCLRTSA